MMKTIFNSWLTSSCRYNWCRFCSL